ncbi:MAG: alanine--tRNA ligase, partial [Dehalococcoidia bacterium]
TAGMVQFKSYFTGEATAPSPRLASCQKCFRTTDIDSVGDSKHLTFFEMLGNFSVGDYFKREAIEWAWEFVTQRLKLPLERLWFSIFLDDDEAFNYWRELGVPAERILRFGEEENFWGPAGETGPCGPCSEIHYDLGEGIGCGRPDCGPGCECGRFIEIWNLVFTQYDQQSDGRRIPLPKPNIDTGMGLERMAAVMQGKVSVYETDLFVPIMKRVSELAGQRYGQDETIDRALRVVAEHGRAITFLIGDGVVPSNEGRGYVLRRVLRRAALFGRKLGLNEPFLGGLAEAVISQMRHEYPEIERGRELILSTVEAEESRFNQTLDRGLEILRGLINYRGRHGEAITELLSLAKVRKPSSENASAILEKYGFVGYDTEAEPFEQVGEQMAAESVADLLYQALKSQEEDAFIEAEARFLSLQEWSNHLSGQEVFELYDTYGFPPELTAEIAAENGLSVDLEGFEEEMERQRERARAAQKIAVGGGRVDMEGVLSIKHIPKSTDFVGDETLKHQSTVVVLLPDGEWPEDRVVTVSQGQHLGVILRETPFYGEMGGQVGDTGEIRGEKGRMTVTNTVRHTVSGSELIVHQGKVVEGQISVDDIVEAVVDEKRRLDIARNPTATHLLQMALRQVLGSQVQQSGSLVAPDRLRFDFTYLGALTMEQLLEAQRIVNEKVRQNLPVKAGTTSYSEAIAQGALAFFGEKYGEEVRMVEIGEPIISAELCGGTHVGSTGEIGLFIIVGESSIGAGMRRIEALSGRGAEEFVHKQLSLLEEAAQELRISAPEIKSRISELQAELDAERRKALALERESLRKRAKELAKKAVPVGDFKILTESVEEALSIEALREMGDFLKEELGKSAFVLGAVFNDRPSFVAMGTADVVARGFHAGRIVKQVAAVPGGGGGGTAELGQGGGKDKEKLSEALDLAQELLRKLS